MKGERTNRGTIRNSDGIANIVSNVKNFNKMKRKLKAIHNNDE